MPVVFGSGKDRERFRLTLSDDVTMVDSVQGLATHLDEHGEEDLVLIDADVPMQAAIDIAERYRVERPSLGVLLLRNRVELQTLSEALRAGIREVVASDDAEALLAASRRSHAVSRQFRSGDRDPEAPGRGKVIVVFSAKGGCGKTTLATNLAMALARGGSTRVCLADYDFEFGDVAISLQVDPARTLSDALGMQGGLDRHGVESIVLKARNGLDVLLAPTSPADAEYIDADLAGVELELLAESYDYVVVDTPPAFNDTVLRALDIADSYVLLTTLDMMALKNFKVTLDTLDALGYPRSRWQVVLNRFDSSVGLSPVDVERTLAVPIAAKLPSARDVPSSVNAGEPLVSLNPRHPYSRAVAKLAQSQAVSTSRTPTSRSGLFGLRRVGA